MSNYTKSTNFATKDNLTPGDPLKIVRGTEIDTEFNNIATAVATKTDNSAAAITGGTITGITDLAVADGGTGASTAAGALNNLLPSQTSNANKYLQTDGTNATWDAVTLSTADITGVLPVANGGTGLSSLGSGITTFLGTPSSANLASAVTDETGSGALVFANSPTLVTPALGTPTSATLTNATGLPLSTGISGLGTGVATALAINTPNTGAMVVNGGALGTPSSGVVTNLTGTANININGLVGVTTANNGNFTSINASSTVNLSAGTVDGVLYLDASKNITTGSVLSFSGVHLTSNRNKDTTYSATDFTTYPNGFVLQNSATPATGIFNSIYFKNNGNMQNVFGVVQNSSGYGDFVWAGLAASHTEWMRLASTGLTLTSNPTLSGGTANGVTYLNGSKVLTSGSALTFDGTTLGSTGGVKVTGTAASLAIDGGTLDYASNNTRLAAGRAGGNYSQFDLYVAGASGVTKRFSSFFNTTFAWYATDGTSELMRLDATGLGIGTSSPSAKLQVGATTDSSNVAKVTVSSSGIGYLGVDSSGTNGVYLIANNSGSTQTGVVTGGLGLVGQGAYPLIFGTNSTERMRLDSSGNLGLGVTPSAWDTSPYKAFQIGAGVGSASVIGRNDSVNGGGLALNAYYSSTGYRYIGSSFASLYLQASGQHQFYTAASGTAGDAISFTQAMTLDANGTLIVGSTSPMATSASTRGQVSANGSSDSVFVLGVGGTATSRIYTSASSTTVGTYTNTPLILDTNSTERARIDSSGNFLVGTTTATQNDSTSFSLNTNGNLYCNHITGSGNGSGYVQFSYAGTIIGGISQSGTTGVLYNVTSDQRLKENIVNAPEFGSIIDSIQVRSFDWKTDQTHQRAGFVAQELLTVAPEAVYQPNDTEEMMAVDYSKLVPMLVKEIQSLRQRLSAANL